jgi:hypothetical protein
MKARETMYASYLPLTVFIGTWNVAAATPPYAGAPRPHTYSHVLTNARACRRTQRTRMWRMLAQAAGYAGPAAVAGQRHDRARRCRRRPAGNRRARSEEERQYAQAPPLLGSLTHTHTHTYIDTHIH